MYDTNPELKLAADFIQYTGKNIFLSGKAGTGKTTFLRRLKENSPKRMIVTAPTGVAAINAGGVTLHSFFQLPFGPYLPDYRQTNDKGIQINRFNKEKINIIKSLDLLVIDEISMVRADILDGIDAVLRRFRDRNKAFGGVQLLMIGDLQQLSPVIRENEWELLQPHYKTPYFFSSRALGETDYIGIELKTIYRQNDDKFISILNKIRDNQIDESSLSELNKRYIPGFFHQDTDGYITLTTHNQQAQQLNASKLANLPGKLHTFAATTEGEFPEYAYPTDHQLALKEGAQVMFIKNDISPQKLFFNGKIGKITAILQDKIHVLCTGDQHPIVVDPTSWENMKYEINPETKEIRETKIGSFTQYPLKTAWAITIHKSQGLTFEHAIVDANASFAHGQVYVALSRCKSLDGLVLTAPLSERSIINDTAVRLFSENMEQDKPSLSLLEGERLNYQRQLILDLFDFSSLQQWIRQCQTLLRIHPGALPPATGQVLDQMMEAFKTDITQISVKFLLQIEGLYADGTEINETLQDRIKKGSVYFLEKLQSVVHEQISQLSIETDNKQFKKSWNDYFQKLQQETRIKTACLIVSLNGFQVKEHLQARAKAFLEEPVKTEKKKQKATPLSSSPTDNQNADHPELFETLRKWRSGKAAEQGLPAYIVMHQKTLFDLVNKLPETYQELSEVSGFGQKKLKQYGQEVLEIVRRFK